jgi:ornithine carbamoyltransferase
MESMLMIEQTLFQGRTQQAEGYPVLRHFLQLSDFTLDEYEYLFKRTAIIKQLFKSYITYQPLNDRTLAMVFEKQSTRTRVSFEAGMSQLGGNSINLMTSDTQLGRGEPIEDMARVITRMVDVVMIRTFEQSILERFAAHSRVPVINGLTNEYHPCQILADIYTYTEFRGSIHGKTVSWIGDANNMCLTWLQAAKIFGFHLNISTPKGYELEESILENSHLQHFTYFEDPMEAAKASDLVTTDVWTSMGFDEEKQERNRAFADFQVDAEMMAQAKSDALFMHCLPAYRGVEVSAEVLDSPQSVIWDEAENRLHVQKALLEFLLLGRLKNA